MCKSKYTNPEPLTQIGEGRLVFPGVSEEDDFRMEVIEELPGDGGDGSCWYIYRFDLEKFQVVEDDNHLYLVSSGWNQSWPHALSVYEAWFHHHLEKIAYLGTSAQELRTALCAEDPLKRAWALCAVGDYYGFLELDSYPLVLRQHEVHSRYGLLRNCACDTCLDD